MHDLETIKRLNRNPSNNGQDKPAPQPTRYETARYTLWARTRLLDFKARMQSPAMEREALGE